MVGLNRQFGFYSLLLFCIGALSSYDISLVGRVTAAEILAFAFIPYLWLSKRGSLINRNAVICITILFCMIGAVVAADIWNQNYFWFTARAVARPIFILCFLMFFIPVLVKEPQSVIFMVYGMVVAGIIKLIRPSEFEPVASVDVSSYAGIVFRVQPLMEAIVLAIVLYFYPRNRFVAPFGLLIGGVNTALIGGSRGTILVWTVSSAILFFLVIIKGRYGKRIILTKTKLLAIGVAVFTCLSFAYFAYIYMAPRGILGEGQQVKYENQANNRYGATPWGLLMSGRAPVYGALLGIADRPLTGFGSWRHDLTSVYTYDAIGDVGMDHKIIDAMNVSGIDMGAGHSVLFQAWVENGLVPALCYIVILVIVLKVSLSFCVYHDVRLTAYIVYTATSFSWAFLFSPPGVFLRLFIGLIMAIYVVFLDKQRPLARIQEIR